MQNPTLIFYIKRYAINDGPGIRVTVFFKGCPLSCIWCHNPEGMSRKVQKLYTERKCIGAKECIAVCEPGALMLTASGIITDVDKCTLCGNCAEVCPTKAIEMSGRVITVEDILKILRREQVIIGQSGGGITFSGGEPLHHHRFLLELLRACGEEGYHRCVDTTGFANHKVLMEVAAHTDLWLYDLKIMDPVKHIRYTGVNNKKILENLVALSDSGAAVIIRIPMIKGINDDDENLFKSAEFIASLPHPVEGVELLPYHPVAAHKYAKLGETYAYNHLEPPGKDRLNYAAEVFSGFGIRVSEPG